MIKWYIYRNIIYICRKYVHINTHCMDALHVSETLFISCIH